MKKIKKLKLHFNSIKYRFLVPLIIVSMLMIGVFAIVSYMVFRGTVIEQVGEARSDVLSLISERVKVVRSNAYTLMNLYYYDGRLQSYINNNDGTINKEFKDYLDNKTSQFKKSFKHANLEYSMVLSLESGKGYSSNKLPDDYDYNSIRYKIWYKELYHSKGDIIEIPSFTESASGTRSYSLARSLIDSKDNTIGYLFINIEERQIYDVYKNVAPEESSIYIVDKFGNIVSSNREKLIGFNYFNMENLDRLFGEDDYAVTKLGGYSKLITKSYDSGSSLMVLEEIALEGLLSSLEYIGRLLIIVSGIILLAMCLWLLRFSESIIAPIKRLSKFMTKVEADRLDEECEVVGYNEINSLSTGLNSMLKRIKNLISIQKQKEQQKHEMELSFLQAQINPHFMYNTLFSIKCMVDMQENEKASNMLTSFITLLRSTLSNPNELITIKEELALLRKFMEILRLRYTNQVLFIVECEPSLEDYKIPKLLIQPLVENAIFHGLDSEEGKGCVSVIVREEGRDIQIIVDDDGKGMNSKALASFNSQKKSRSSHVGLENVRNRTQLYFGEEYGVRLESELDIGTRAVISIPKTD